MKRSEIQETPGFRPDGLHPGYGVFVQPLRDRERPCGNKGIDRYYFPHYYSYLNRYAGDTLMRTVQITLEDELAQAVDRAAGRLDL